MVIIWTLLIELTQVEKSSNIFRRGTRLGGGDNHWIQNISICHDDLCHANTEGDS